MINFPPFQFLIRWSPSNTVAHAANLNDFVVYLFTGRDNIDTCIYTNELKMYEPQKLMLNS